MVLNANVHSPPPPSPESPRRRGFRYLARILVGFGIVIVAACPRTITDSGYVLTLSPPAADLFVDDSAKFTASLVNQNGEPVSTGFIWSVDNPAVASVSGSGMVRALARGTALLTVSARGESATAELTIAADDGQTLSVTPDDVSLYVQHTQRLKAILENRHGDTLSANPQWKSDNPAVATVDATGLVKAVGTGTTTVTATVAELSASARVSVTPQPANAVLVGAGDIASCSSSGDEATAKLLDGIPGTVFTTGDNAYESGTAAEFENCYGPSWGRHKARTRPQVGNHEYFTFGALPYFEYFGAAAGEAGKGYYSYNLGAWHIISLNSNLAMSPGSPEEQWLRADLADHPARCTLAYWHHPRFSSGPHGNSVTLQPLWDALYEAGADVVLSGHDHIYERFAPQTPTGAVDLARGIRQFIVGTGGEDLYTIGEPAPNSEVRGRTRGVLKLTLYADRYEWKFVPVAGASFTDTGSASCH